MDAMAVHKPWKKQPYYLVGSITGHEVIKGGHQGKVRYNRRVWWTHLWQMKNFGQVTCLFKNLSNDVASKRQEQATEKQLPNVIRLNHPWILLPQHWHLIGHKDLLISFHINLAHSSLLPLQHYCLASKPHHLMPKRLHLTFFWLTLF